jgi:hypothetical protein
MVSGKDTVDERDVYTPPCVMRISDLKQCAGQKIRDYLSGSGNSNTCGDGINRVVVV